MKDVLSIPAEDLVSWKVCEDIIRDLEREKEKLVNEIESGKTQRSTFTETKLQSIDYHIDIAKQKIKSITR